MTPQSPLLSVIIPVYNIAPYLERCLDSVVGQSYQNLEIIVVNDGSTDNSLEIAQKYASTDNRIRIVSQANKGLPSARKAGIEVATGLYAHHLDGDDYIESDAYQLLMDEILRQKADLLLFDFWFQDETTGNKTQSVAHGTAYYKKEDYLNKIFLNGGYFAVWSHIHKRSLYDHPITIYRDVNIGEDALLTSQLAYYAEKIVVFQEKPLLHYMIRNSSMSNTKVSQSKINDFLRFPHLIREFFQSKPIAESLRTSLDALTIQSFNHVVEIGYLKEIRPMSQEAMKLFRRTPQLRHLRSTRSFYKFYYCYSLAGWIGKLFTLYYQHKKKIKKLEIL